MFYCEYGMRTVKIELSECILTMSGTLSGEATMGSGGKEKYFLLPLRVNPILEGLRCPGKPMGSHKSCLSLNMWLFLGDSL